jgi:hypothetical protein
VLALAVVLTVTRSEVGRVALVVFTMSLIEVILGTTALLNLFKTLGAFGQARGILAHIEALAATALVLMVATLSMNGVLWVGLALLGEIVE